jgi:PadR family transcriptional regulator, regulatory protein PadR
MSVLAALLAQPSQWQHGYALAKETHLKSGTLYPILIRLADRGLVEAEWQDEPEPGRPRRHLYRLTADGLAVATAALAAAQTSLAVRKDPARPSRRPRPAQTVTAHGGPAHGGPAHGGPAHGGPAHGGPAHGGPAHGVGAREVPDTARVSSPGWVAT